MTGYSGKARSLRAHALLCLTLLALLFLFGLPALRSSPARAAGATPQRQLIGHRASLSIPSRSKLVHIRSSTAPQPRGPIYRAEIHGVITSVTIAYLRRVLQLVEAANANVLIIQMSTSGAVLRDVRPFAGELARARVPVVVYVTPMGTQAGAAGALFLSAAHISALTPQTPPARRRMSIPVCVTALPVGGIP